MNKLLCVISFTLLYSALETTTVILFLQRGLECPAPPLFDYFRCTFPSITMTVCVIVHCKYETWTGLYWIEKLLHIHLQKWPTHTAPQMNPKKLPFIEATKANKQKNIFDETMNQVKNSFSFTADWKLNIKCRHLPKVITRVVLFFRFFRNRKKDTL